MIDDYFRKLEKTILDFKVITKSHIILKKLYNDKQGYIKGDIIFNKGTEKQNRKRERKCQIKTQDIKT